MDFLKKLTRMVDPAQKQINFETTKQCCEKPIFSSSPY